MTEGIVTAVQTHGAVAVFVLMLVEGTGFPLPSEVIMPLAGALTAGAVGGQSDLTLVSAILLGSLGNTVGAVIAYGIAARWGTGVLRGPGRRLGITAGHLERTQRLFARHGLALVLVGRCLPIVRGLISYPAGVAHVGVARYTAATAAGVLPFCALLAAGGHLLGAEWERVAVPLERLALLGSVGGALVLAVALVSSRRARPGAAGAGPGRADAEGGEDRR